MPRSENPKRSPPGVVPSLAERRRRWTRAIRLACAGFLSTLLPGAARLQAQAVDGERVVWRGLIGETAIEVRASHGNVQVGAAGEVAAASVTLRATDVRRFLDSLTRRLAPARARDTSWTLRMEEPGVSPGTLSVAPADRGPDRKRRYRLFVADDVVATVRQVLDLRELTLLVRKLREASAPPPRRVTPRKVPTRKAPPRRPNARTTSG